MHMPQIYPCFGRLLRDIDTDWIQHTVEHQVLCRASVVVSGDLLFGGGLGCLGFVMILRYIKFIMDPEFNIRSAELHIENYWKAIKPHQFTPKTKISLWNIKLTWEAEI